MRLYLHYLAALIGGIFGEVEHASSLDPEARITSSLFYTREYMKNDQTLIRDDFSTAHVMVSREPDTMQRVLVCFPALNSGSFIHLQALSDDLQVVENVQVIEQINEVTTYVDDDGFNGVDLEVSLRQRARLQESIFGSIRIIRDYVEGRDDDGNPVIRKGENDFKYEMFGEDNARITGGETGLRKLTFVRTFFFAEDEVRFTIESEDVMMDIVEANRGPENVDIGLFHVNLIPTGTTGTLKIRTGINVPPPAPMSPVEIFWNRDILDHELVDQMAFLSTEDGWLTGSWRFLTYFGRDTLLSLFLLFDEMSPAMIQNVLEAALGRVSMGRNNMSEWPGDWDRETDTTGFVCHEDEIGDFANWNGGSGPTISERLMKCDYKHADSDYLILPILAKFAQREPARVAALLSSDCTLELNPGRKYQEMLNANALAVLRQTALYQFEPKYENLVKIRAATVGNWRDSNEGLAYTRYPLDINVAFVPAALNAIITLADAGHLETAYGEDARQKAAVWEGAIKHFEYTVPERTEERLRSYILEGSGCPHCDGMHERHSAIMETFLGVGIYEDGTVAPLLNSDYGFLLAFLDDVPEKYIIEAGKAVSLQFPRGLHTDAGLLTASAAYMWNLTNENYGNDLAIALGRGGYHGAVIWGWQSVMMAAGLKKHLSNPNISGQTYNLISQALTYLWDGIEYSVADQGAAEMWTFDYNSQTGATTTLDFASEGTEGNMVQLWSFTVMANERPAGNGVNARPMVLVVLLFLVALVF